MVWQEQLYVPRTDCGAGVLLSSQPSPGDWSMFRHPHPAHNTYLFVTDDILPQEEIGFDGFYPTSAYESQFYKWLRVHRNLCGNV